VFSSAMTTSSSPWLDQHMAVGRGGPGARGVAPEHIWREVVDVRPSACCIGWSQQCRPPGGRASIVYVKKKRYKLFRNST
jgi:hypothetical protein